MGRTLHNVKASLMLCFWRYEPRKFIKLVKNIVRSECLRVWLDRIPGCVGGYLISSYTLSPEDTRTYIGVGTNSVSFNSKGLLRTSTAGKQKWIPAFFISCRIPITY